jgi:uroporphyrinogen-III decarboxylase
MTPNPKQLGYPAEWSTMTPAQKREWRINKFLNPDIQFVSPEAAQRYRVRAQRLVDAYNLKEPDQVPIMLPVGSLPLIMDGVSMYEAMYQPEKGFEACNKFNEKYSEELDYFAAPMAAPGDVFEILDYKLYSWPGHGLSRQAPGYQYVEGEYMKANEYEDLLRDPSDYWLRTYLPRVFGSFEPFRMFTPLTDILEIPMGQLMPLAFPQVQEALQKLIDAGKALQKRIEITAKHMKSGPAHGFPQSRGLLNVAPFDALGDTLRGTKAITLDLFRRPDKILKALDTLTPIIIHAILNNPMAANALTVVFPLHKGADGWMSSKQYETLYWPSLKKVMDALINEGIICVMFAEGSYESRLQTVKSDFPKGSVVWWFDQTNMARAKEVLGDTCCIQGNVPSSLIVTGDAAAVKENCRKLIESCAKGGGYILGAGCVADNPKLENLRAMVESVKEYGRSR